MITAVAKWKIIQFLEKYLKGTKNIKCKYSSAHIQIFEKVFKYFKYKYFVFVPKPDNSNNNYNNNNNDNVV